MFKIKKSAKRVIARDPLLETNPNQQSQLVRNSRPHSVRLVNRNLASQQIIPTLEKDPTDIQNQSCQSRGDSSFRYPLLVSREALEEEVRRLSAVVLKDQITRFGEFKEELIKKVTEKGLFKEEVWGQNRQQHLVNMIHSEIDKLERAKSVRMRCEQRQSKIQTMITDRLAKLASMR